MTAGDRYHAVLERVGAAALRVGRSPAEIRVVAAAKTFSDLEIRSVLAAGCRDIGENYVQEAKRKRAAIECCDIRWHFLGRLQRNKAAAAVGLFDCIHSLDSVALGRSLDRAARARGAPISCLVEVNVGAEGGKGGTAPEALADLLDGLGAFSFLRVEGLMSIPPATESPECSRPFFARLRELRDELARLRLPAVHLKELSMGMSADFEVAVEEGATLIRVGTAIFGPRPAKV